VKDYGVIPPEARAALVGAGYDRLHEVARADPHALAAQVPGAGEADARTWLDAAQLALLRGIGTENAERLWGVGVRRVGELATVDPGHLHAALRDAGAEGPRFRPAIVRVWVRAARRHVSS
jgi:predicted flap endonuclease-1-like 5' DNA nuclease